MTKKETGHRHHLMDTMLSGVHRNHASEISRQGATNDSLHAHNLAGTA